MNYYTFQTDHLITDHVKLIPNGDLSSNYNRAQRSFLVNVLEDWISPIQNDTELLSLISCKDRQQTGILSELRVLNVYDVGE